MITALIFFLLNSTWITAYRLYSVKETKSREKRDSIVPQIYGGESKTLTTAVALFNSDVNDDDDEVIKAKSQIVCAASILTERIVLTAGHCVEKITNVAVLTVVAGEGDLTNYIEGRPNDAVTRRVKRIVMHPNYVHVEGKKLVWDLALMEVS